MDNKKLNKTKQMQNNDEERCASDLFMNCLIYDKDIILKAAKDFRSLADVEIVDNGYNVCFEIKDKRIDSREFAKEFSNYVLGLMKQKMI